MAICKVCKREMVTAHGCIEHEYVHNGKRIPAIKFGSEQERFESSPNDICHDCNVRVGEYHHPGCDVETCPVCGGQLLSCGCFVNQMEIVFLSPATAETNK